MISLEDGVGFGAKSEVTHKKKMEIKFTVSNTHSDSHAHAHTVICK